MSVGHAGRGLRPKDSAMQKILRIDPKDNLIVALRDLAQGDIIENEGQRIQLVTDVPG